MFKKTKHSAFSIAGDDLGTLHGSFDHGRSDFCLWPPTRRLRRAHRAFCATGGGLHRCHLENLENLETEKNMVISW